FWVDLISCGVSCKVFCGHRCCPAPQERIKNRVAHKCEHADQSFGKLFGEHGEMLLLSLPCKVPVSREIFIPLGGGQLRQRFGFCARFRRRAELLEYQNELVVYLDDAVPGKWEGPHNARPPRGARRWPLLPDTCAHLVAA